MKTIYIISSLVFNSPTTKVEKFRFDLLPNNSVDKEIKTEKTDRIEFWKWFNSVEDAEQYLKTL